MGRKGCRLFSNLQSTCLEPRRSQRSLSAGEVVSRLHVLYKEFHNVDEDQRFVDLDSEAREVYCKFLDEAGQAQEEYMYSHIYATSVLGKLPELALRSAVLAWGAAYLAEADDAALVAEVVAEAASTIKSYFAEFALVVNGCDPEDV